MQKGKRQIAPRQSLLDLAVQHYGSAEGILDLVKSGQFSTFSSATDSTKKVSIGKVIDMDVVAAMTKTDVTPTTYKKIDSNQAFSSGFSNGFQ